jgi:hypothetical protein
LAYKAAERYCTKVYYSSLGGPLIDEDGVKGEKEEEEEVEAEGKPLELNSQLPELSITPADEPDGQDRF